MPARAEDPCPIGALSPDTPLTVEGTGVLSIRWSQRSLSGPLAGELGTHKTVKARFWPWLSGENPQNMISVFFFDWKRSTQLHVSPHGG